MQGRLISLVTPNRDRVVGYSSIGLFRSPLNKAEKKQLLRLARKSVVDYVTERKRATVKVDNPKLRADGAVFVTIKRNGRLRGCVGNIIPINPLYESVMKNSIAACSNDSRFPPMTPSELYDMEIEVSILSPLVPLKDPRTVQVGRDGLYLVRGGRGRTPSSAGADSVRMGPHYLPRTAL